MTKEPKQSNFISIVNEILKTSRERKVTHLYTEDERLEGRIITINGKKQVNFGSCSYLGLEFDSRLKEASIEAIRNFGTQFSSSRAYVSFTLYEQLEGLLQKIFGHPVILSTCTSLGHQAVIPTIIESRDVVILDQQAHYSMHEAASKLQLKGIELRILRHNRLDDLQKMVDELSTEYNRIWYLIDGVYSMYGDFAPIKELVEMLDRNKKLYLYADDAHGMSWTGNNGSGYVQEQVGFHPKMVLATSLAKGFGSGGGVFVIPDEEMYWRVKNWGGPLTFSGPQQPAVIGASIASAKIHLSDEITTLQNSLKENIRFFKEVVNHYNLPLISQAHTPISFIGVGLNKVGYNLINRLTEAGFYANLGVFPAVPQTCTGIRITINNNHTKNDLEKLAETLNYHLPKALKDEDRDINDIYRAFKTLRKDKEDTDSPRNIGLKGKTFPIIKPEFSIQHETTIKAIDKDLWNSLLANNGSYDWNALLLFEDSFSNNEKPEENWDFHYYIIRDKDNMPVVATFFTVLLSKDDMLSEEEISKKIELMRETDPYHLTSKSFMMGTSITEGEHIYINRNHSEWKKAFISLLDEIWAEHERQKTSTLFFRDFKIEDEEIKTIMLDRGFIRMELPPTHVLLNDGNIDVNEYATSLPHKKKYDFKKDVLRYEPLFDVEIAQKPSADEIEHWYQLYKNVRSRSLTINSFYLPKKLFTKIATSPHWDVIVLKLKKECNPTGQNLTVAIGLVHKSENYCPLILGMDYNYSNTYNVYKQMLYQTIILGLKANSSKIYLGLTASLDKRKLGAEAVNMVAYIQIKDTLNMSIIEMIPR